MCILGLGKCISVQMLETRNLAVGGDKLIWIVGMWTRTLRCWVGGKVIIHTNLLFKKKNIYIYIESLSTNKMWKQGHSTAMSTLNAQNLVSKFLSPPKGKLTDSRLVARKIQNLSYKVRREVPKGWCGHAKTALLKGLPLYKFGLFWGFKISLTINTVNFLERYLQIQNNSLKSGEGTGPLYERMYS